MANPLLAARAGEWELVLSPLATESSVVLARRFRYFKMQLILRSNLKHCTVNVMYDERREEMAVCNKQRDLREELLSPKDIKILIKRLVAICIPFHFNLH